MSEKKVEKNLTSKAVKKEELRPGSSNQLLAKSSDNKMEPRPGASNQMLAKSSDNKMELKPLDKPEAKKRSSRDAIPNTGSLLIKSSNASIAMSGVSSEFITHNPRRFDRELRNRRNFPRSQGAGLANSSSVQSVSSLTLTTGEDYDHVGGRSAGEKSYTRGQSRSSVAIKSSVHTQPKGDLEMWWINSPIWRRTVPLMCIIMLLMTLTHAGLAIYYLVAKDTAGADYDVCKTPACMDIAHWIKEGLDREVDPCENFYQFACNGYSGTSREKEAVPDEINFDSAKFTFNTKSGLASILKLRNDPKNLILPFYKSCIDLRKTSATDTQTLAYIISLTMPYLREEPVNFDENIWFNEVAGAATVTNLIGHCGLMRIKFLEFPNIALLPPIKWISKFSKKLSTPKGIADYKAVVSRSYRRLWEALEPYGGVIANLSHELASSLAVDMLNVVSNLKFDHAGTELDSDNFQYIDSIIGAGWRLEVLPMTDKNFTAGDMNYIIDQLYTNISEVNRSRAFASYWIFCILEYYQNELSDKSREELSIQKVFTADTHLQRDSSLERFCFDALTNHMYGYTMNQLVHELKDVRRLLPNVRRDGRMIMRALRDIYYAEDLQEYLTSYQSKFMEYFLNPTTNISLQFPFPHSTRTQKYFDEEESYMDNIKPGDNYLLNVRELTMHKIQGELKSWREGKLDYKMIPNENLESILEHIDNGVEYMNIISPPIVLFDQPLYGNEMGVFDRAGATILLARSYLSLLKQNWKDSRALTLHFIHPKDLQEMEKRPQMLGNFLKGKCIFNYTADYRVSFFGKKSSRDALALAIAFRMFKNPDRYQTVYFKGNDSVAKGVEQFYKADGTVIYVIYRPEWSSSNKFEKLNSDDFKPVPSYRKKQKFSYKKLPLGLEDFNKEQLFFIAAIRHHCYPRNDSHPYSANVNAILEQLPEFSKTWNCPLGSSMNPHSKCMPQGSY